MPTTEYGEASGDGPIIVDLTLRRTLRGETVIFPEGMAGVTVIQPGGDDSEREHIDRMLAIEAGDGPLVVTLRSGEVLEADRIDAGGIGMKTVRVYLTDGTTRTMNATDHIQRITAGVNG